MTDVVVTGMGAVSSAGLGVDALWDSMVGARPPEPVPARELGEQTLGDVPCQAMPAGVLDGLPDRMGHVPLGTASRAAVLVADMAVAQAGLTRGGGRTAVIVASGVADAGLVESWRTGAATPPDRWVPSYSLASVVADRLGADLATGLSNACAGGSYAISMGADLIRTGAADVVVAGAVETFSRVIAASFTRLGALDPLGARPFHRKRAGTSLAEGAGAVVLESAEHAAARGAEVLGTLRGSGWSCDAHHATAPDPAGTQIARAVRDAFAEAGRSYEELSVVVPHATGTELSDVTEAAVLGEVLGDRVRDVPLYSMKALIGHTGSASGILGSIAALGMLARRTVPGNVEIDDLDPLCPVRLSFDALPLGDGLALVNAFGFGGHNASLLFEGVS